MSYKANQYNYATPLSSVADFTSESSPVADRKYFSLFDNVLDGSYVPIEGDVGLWGSSISGTNGALSAPFVIDVVETMQLRAIKLVGSQYSYPVDFTIELYNGEVLLHTVTEVDNNKIEYVRFLPEAFDITSYRVRITRISAANTVARLHGAHNVDFIQTADTLSVGIIDDGNASLTTEVVCVVRNDVLSINLVNESSHIKNVINTTHDTLYAEVHPIGDVLNVHSAMKKPSRRIYGKVYVTYTDPMLDSETSVVVNSAAYNSQPLQVVDNKHDADHPNFFNLYANDLSGEYVVSDENSQVGWTTTLSNADDGTFDVEPVMDITFVSRPLTGLKIIFDDSHGCIAEDFTVEYHTESGYTLTTNITGNTQREVIVHESTVADVVAVSIHIHKAAVPGYPVIVLEVPILSTILYEGLQGRSDLMSIDALEELSYMDDIEALGGISANEVTVVFDNSKSDFYFNNTKSPIATQMRRNRKIVPWLGVEIVDGEIEWYSLGVYWSYRWNVPVGGLTATVVGFDTIGLLDTSSFVHHDVQVNSSIGKLIEYVLADAKTTFGFIDWKIDPALYDTIIPYAWFDAASHTAALRKISQAYPMHIYCDRDGRICAAPQKLHLDYYYDTWSDSNTVISKEYSSLHTVVPNIVNVTVNGARLSEGATLAQDDLVFSVADVFTRTLNFNKPYVSDLVITVDKDPGVNFSYHAHSWGVEFTFLGTGDVRSIKCTGTCVDTSNTSTLTRRDDNSVRLNGAITRDVVADFIQTSSIATKIMNRIFDLAKHDRYDVNVKYRGDISLTINDPIRLLDGIAPDNRYNIRRQQLSWNGALTGNADLNT